MPHNVPILCLDQILIASIQASLSDSDLKKLESRLLQKVTEVSAKGVVIDVSVLDVLDSFGTHVLDNIAAAAQLRGARMVIVGIMPEVALSMVLLGLDLKGVETALDLDDGLKLLNNRPAS
jgi:rsbT antagonist protein RsbS